MNDQTISHYRITERLGAGGMGVVYLAYDPRLERNVALKVLSDQLGRDGAYRRRFLSEARSASALNHPNIVTVYEVGSDQERDFIAMEHVEGQTLQARINADEPITIGELLDVAIQLASGLAAAHAAGVVHRDLKPGNVIVRPDGAVKILDFGLARRQVAPSADSGEGSESAPTIAVTMTEPGMLLGTPGFMAPEQARGEGGDHRSDLFSFGCILYAMATGATPFRGDTVIDVLHNVMHQEPTPIDADRADLPLELQAVVARCLAKDPEDRFADAEDLERSLREIRDALTSGTLGGPGARSGTARRPQQRGLLTTAGVAVAAVVVVLGYLAFKPSPGVATTMVSVVDEEGREIQRAIPTREHRSRLAVLPFEPAFADSSQFWQGYAASNLLLMDIFQDYYVTIDQMAEYEFCQEALKSGFPGGRGAPVALKRQVARASGCSHFVTGRVGEEAGAVWTEVELYLTDSGRLVATFRREGPSLAAVTDESSVWLRRELGVPQQHLQTWPDLPIADISTASPAALEAYGRALVAIYEHNDIAGMRGGLETAVAEDASFAWALWSLYISYIFAGEGANPRIAQVLDDLMTHLYRLPERLQFAVKSTYFEHNGDAGKQLAVLKMWAELYPDDNLAHEVLVQLHWIRGETEAAFASQARLLELEPDNAAYLTQAATMHREKGDLEQARRYLESLVASAPEDPQPLASLGRLLALMGEHEQARESFEKAIIIQPRNLEYRLALADAEFNLGNLATAVELKEAVLADPLNPAELVAARNSLARTYQLTGRIDRAIEILSDALREGEGQVSPLELLSVRARLARLHASRGDREQAGQIVAELKERLTHPLTIVASLFAMRVYVELGDIPAVRLAADEVKTAIDEMKWEHMRPSWLMGMAAISESESEFEAARGYYDRWLELEPTEAEAMSKRGRCLRSLGELEAARNDLARALRQEPHRADFLAEAAMIEHERGNGEAAISLAERALEVWADADPSFAPALEARQTLDTWQHDTAPPTPARSP